MKWTPINHCGRRCVAAALTGAMLFSLIPAAAAESYGGAAPAAGRSSAEYVTADWKFGQAYTSGSIAGSSSPADMSLTMNGPTVSKQRSTTEAQ